MRLSTMWQAMPLIIKDNMKKVNAAEGNYPLQKKLFECYFRRILRVYKLLGYKIASYEVMAAWEWIVLDEDREKDLVDITEAFAKTVKETLYMMQTFGLKLTKEEYERFFGFSIDEHEEKVSAAMIERYSTEPYIFFAKELGMYQ